MNKRKTIYCILACITISIIVCIASCPFSLLKARVNSLELYCVYLHYILNDDKEKKEAIYFLLSNIGNHYSYTSNAIESFTSIVKNSDSIIKEPQLGEIWTQFSPKDQKETHWDIRNIKSETLISDIDFAFGIWRKSPWRKEVCFKNFCSYILPYRVMNEKVETGWREYLYKTYKPVISNTKDLKKAFYLVHDSLQRKIKHEECNYPYQMNAFELENIMKGSCLQRCIYEVAVMRALGIPAAIDGIDCWSNYSKNGHTWVTLVAQDGTYTVAERDTVARKGNPIDSSIFKLRKNVSSDFHCDTTFKKRCAKILRYHFNRTQSFYNDQDAPKEIYARFTDTSVDDVSATYGFKNCFSIPAKKSDYCYLCVYLIGKGWHPIAYTRKANGKYCFKNIGDSCIYMPAIYKNKKLIPLSNPVKITGSKQTIINPTEKTSCNVTVNRKYPLVNNFITEWARLEGSKLIGYSKKGSKDSCILWTINKTPLYINRYKPDYIGKWECIKFLAPKGIKSPFAEIIFSHNRKKINVTASCNDSRNIQKCIDGDYFTFPKIDKRSYQVLFNLEVPTQIDEITLVTKNDGNFVVPGHSYTLLYYNMGWKTISSKRAKTYSITFEHVPTNALLLLKDNTEGVEERPFIYQNHRQYWW